MRFKKICNEAVCSFTITANGPLMIADGSSNRTDPSKPDTCFLTGIVDGERVYVIPGSSIKGVVRGYVEDMLGKEKTEMLFGSEKPAIKSKVSFYDAFADMSTVKTDIRYNTAISAIGQNAVNGSLNSVEALVKGSFPAKLTVKNAEEKELLYILKALRALDTGELCIGGRKSRGYGLVNINDFSLRLFGGYDNDLKPVMLAEFDDVRTAISSLESGALSLHTEVLYE